MRGSTVSKEASARSLLHEYVVRLLIERGIGSKFAAEEAAAQKAVEDATRDIEAWDREASKKAAFLDWASDNGVKPDSAAAQRKKKESPQEYAWDPKILQKTEKSLKDALSQARERLARYNPELADVPKKAKAKRVGMFAVEGTPPDTQKRVYVAPSALPRLTVIPWSSPEFNRARQAKWPDLGGFGESKENAGHPGEERLAFLFGAQRQGDQVSFDLIDQSGKRWEVKGLKTAGAKIRPGGEGAAAFSRAAAWITAVCRQMQKFVKEVKAQGIDKVCNGDQQKKMVAIVDRVLKDELYNVVRKELSEERLGRVLLALRATTYLKSAWEHGIGQKVGGKVSVRDNDVQVADRREYIDILNRLSSKPGGEKVLDEIDARERCLFKLVDPLAFVDPVKWMDKWDASVDVNRIFPGVDGLIVVWPFGFAIIERPDLRKVLVFRGSSQDVPKYSVNLEGNEEEHADEGPEAAIA